MILILLHSKPHFKYQVLLLLTVVFISTSCIYFIRLSSEYILSGAQLSFNWPFHFEQFKCKTFWPTEKFISSFILPLTNCGQIWSEGTCFEFYQCSPTRYFCAAVSLSDIAKLLSNTERRLDFYVNPLQKGVTWP